VPNWLLDSSSRTIARSAFHPIRRRSVLFAKDQNPANRDQLSKDWTLEPIRQPLVIARLPFIHNVESGNSFEPFPALQCPSLHPTQPLSVNEQWKRKKWLEPLRRFRHGNRFDWSGQVLAHWKQSGGSGRTLCDRLHQWTMVAHRISVCLNSKRRQYISSGPLRGYKADAWEAATAFLHRPPGRGVVEPGRVNDSSSIKPTCWAQTVRQHYLCGLPKQRERNSLQRLLSALQGWRSTLVRDNLSQVVPSTAAQFPK